MHGVNDATRHAVYWALDLLVKAAPLCVCVTSPGSLACSGMGTVFGTAASHAALMRARLPCRAEAEARNVEALIAMGHLEDAHAAACAQFSMCVDAGLQVGGLVFLGLGFI